MQKCPRNRTTNEKNSSFELKWAKSQTKAQKNSKDDFIREKWWPVRETERLVSYLGDSRIIRESWHVCYTLQRFSYMVYRFNTKSFASLVSRVVGLFYTLRETIDANDSLKANFLQGCENLLHFYFSWKRNSATCVVCAFISTREDGDSRKAYKPACRIEPGE